MGMALRGIDHAVRMAEWDGMALRLLFRRSGFSRDQSLPGQGQFGVDHARRPPGVEVHAFGHDAVLAV